MGDRLKIQLKRIYESPERGDGYRMLIDRLWPRGISKARARLDEWNKTLAPSPSLRKWFHEQKTGYDEFSARYLRELQQHEAALRRVRKISETKKVTLLYASKDRERNHARVLFEALKNL
ncbi:MAG TPA: DUF488 family protein [Chryseosolibacter sp.]